MSYDLQPGQTLDNRYRLLSVISSGGMASIFQAKDTDTGETVAIKVPHMRLEADPACFARFQREAEIGKRLQHPNILRFIETPDQQRPYIVMEYVDGRPLGALLTEGEPFPIEEAVKIASSVCEALSYLHEREIIHRDLKPHNIMIGEDGSLRLIDFGLAKSAAMRRITFGGFSPTLGTVEYMAPEQVNRKRGDERTDIYSLGSMLYEMTTGHRPFNEPDLYLNAHARVIGDPVAPRELNPQISEELEEVILHAMERDPRRRFASAAEMKAQLDNLDGVTVTGRCQRLEAPKLWKARWHGTQLAVYSALLPLAFFLVMLLLSKGGHHPHH